LLFNRISCGGNLVSITRAVITVQWKLANIEMDAYVMESMGYVTAGLLDSVVHPDTAVESAILKVRELQLHIACISSGNKQEARLNKCFILFFDRLAAVFVNAGLLPF